jgi:predicted kinase
LTLAEGFAAAARPAIVITHGLSGSGKTTLSEQLVESLSAVRVRSDVERKRLHGLEMLERDRSGVEQGLYASGATEATYARLASAARAIAGAGFVAVVDAASLRRSQRDLFRRLAAALCVPFVIVDFVASEKTLRRRVASRVAANADASDADVAVLEHQLSAQESLGADEMDDVVRYDADAPLERARDPDAWARVRARVDRASASSQPASSPSDSPA